MDAGGAGASHALEAPGDAAAVAALCASLSRASLAGGSGTGVVDSAATAVATVVAALRTHAGDVRVQRSGVAALVKLAAASAASRGAAGAAGAAALVVDAMRAWQQDAELQGSWFIAARTTPAARTTLAAPSRSRRRCARTAARTLRWHARVALPSPRCALRFSTQVSSTQWRLLCARTPATRACRRSAAMRCATC
jgi:hypothetical protein